MQNLSAKIVKDKPTPQLLNVQAWTIHPFPSASSRRVSILNNGLAPDVLATIALSNPVRYNGYMALNKSYICGLRVNYDSTLSKPRPFILPPPDPLLITDISESSPPCDVFPRTALDVLASAPDTMIALSDGTIMAKRKYFSRFPDGLQSMSHSEWYSRMYPPVPTAPSLSTVNKLSRTINRWASCLTPDTLSIQSFDPLNGSMTDIPLISLSPPKAKTAQLAIMAPATPEFDFFISSIPFRCCDVQLSRPPSTPDPIRTPFYFTVEGRLNEPSTAGLSGSLTKTWGGIDVSVVVALVKSERGSNDSYFEEAALVRIGCLMVTLDHDTHASDPTTLQAIRGAQNQGIPDANLFFNGAPNNDYNILITTADTYAGYVQQKSVNPALRSLFSPSTLDKDWAVVPVSSRQWHPTRTPILIASFMHSELWTGRFTWFVSRQAKWSGGDSVPLNFQTMPQASCMRVPGPKNIMVVIFDELANHSLDTLMLGNTSCPVWRNINLAPVVTNFAPIFYWIINNSLESFRESCCYTFNYLTSSVASDDCTTRAMSIVAELSYSNRPGLYSTDFAPGSSLGGAWTVGGMDYTTRRLKTKDIRFGTVSGGNDSSNLCIMGYNLMSYSPFHLLPPSVAECSDIGGVRHLTYPHRLTNPTVQYYCFTTSSFYRLLYAHKLLSTAHSTYKFDTSAGFANYINALACSLSYGTSELLLTDRVPISAVSGGNDDLDSSQSLKIEQYVANYTMGIARHNCIMNFFDCNRSFRNLWNGVTLYYGRPLGDPVFDISSPICFPQMVQWMLKFGHFSLSELGNLHIENITMPDPSHTKALAASSHVNDAIVFSLSASTPDGLSYLPKTYISSDDRYPTSRIGQWYENLVHLTSLSGTSEVFETVKFQFTSKLWMYSSNYYPFDENRATYAHITGSFFANRTTSVPFNISHLTIPDPPTSGFLSAVNNYLVRPFVDGALGFLAGGPVAGVLSAAKVVTHQVMEDLDSRSQEKEPQQHESPALPEAPREVPPPPPPPSEG